MRLIGFNFEKISVEKVKEKVENLKISTNIDVTDIKELKTDILKTKEQIVGVKFTHSVKYEPGLATLELKGSILLSLEEKKCKEVLKEWKNKQMPEDFQTTLFNIIIRKTAAKSLQLEEEMNLPAHIPLPVVRAQKEK